MFSKAEAGDRAWHFLQGWGTILGIENDGREYPVKWRSDNVQHAQSFTLVGYENITAGRPVLYWDEVSIDPPAQPARPLPVDTKVMVWSPHGSWLRRYFHGHGPDGGIYAYIEGNTSWSSDCETVYWEHWELYTED